MQAERTGQAGRVTLRACMVWNELQRLPVEWCMKAASRARATGKGFVILNSRGRARGAIRQWGAPYRQWGTSEPQWRARRRPERMSGWAGRFVSYGAEGAADANVRVQDAWLRLFQERDPRGRFVMTMVRKADQADRSWPRAGARPCSVNSLSSSLTTLSGGCTSCMPAPAVLQCFGCCVPEAHVVRKCAVNAGPGVATPCGVGRQRAPSSQPWPALHPAPSK
jgi:hypothetical protein